MNKTNRKSKERMNVLSVRNKGRNKERMNAFKEKNKRRGNAFRKRNKKRKNVLSEKSKRSRNVFYKRNVVKLLLAAYGSPVYIKVLRKSCPGWTSS